MKKKNPCTSICKFSGPKGWCIGCGRNKKECKKWKTMKSDDKNALLKKLKKRMIKILN
ncbi:MAG: DUF1289 domain-containing protein [Gammaproteobacteria bacterium]